MNKLLLVIAILLASVGVLPADETNPSILWNFGSFNILVPFKIVDAVYLWDFVGKKSMIGAETPIASYKRLQFVAGGVTSIDGQGTPFVGMHLLLVNPAENWIPLSSFKPGLFGGRDFNQDAWVFGVKASVNLF